MLEWLFSWEVTSVVIAVLLGIAFSFLGLDDFKLAKLCFLLTAAEAVGGMLMWGTKTTIPDWTRYLVTFMVMGSVGVLALAALKYTDTKEVKRKIAKEQPEEQQKESPSFLFVFGAPLGENDSPVWIMMLKHYGPKTAYNCDVTFVDNDRKNIEHQWLVKHPNSSFLPAGGVVGQSQIRFQISEAGPEGAPEKFQWTPVDPNNQHYTVSISCRDGVFTENWEITRVDGVLRTKITIEHGPQWVKNNPNQSPIVFTCSEPEFISTALATMIPTNKPKSINPGWKPNHKFEFPVAILDPNGNVQVMAGVKLSDGSQKTDFGCWNMLTKHFGDKQQ